MLLKQTFEPLKQKGACKSLSSSNLISGEPVWKLSADLPELNAVYWKIVIDTLIKIPTKTQSARRNMERFSSMNVSVPCVSVVKVTRIESFPGKSHLIDNTKGWCGTLCVTRELTVRPKKY